MKLLTFIHTPVSLIMLFFISFFAISISQERVIENLREQKEREDRVRLEELEQMRKENQELKERLSALQPQKPPQTQPVNPSLTQNLRPDGEVGRWLNLDILP